MGAFMQPQGHVQVVMDTVDFAMNPQDALEHPRWQWTGGMTIEVEPEFPGIRRRRSGNWATILSMPGFRDLWPGGRSSGGKENGVYAAGATEPARTARLPSGRALLNGLQRQPLAAASCFPVLPHCRRCGDAIQR